MQVKYRDASDGAWKELEVSGKWTDGGRAYMHRSEPNALLAHISKTNDQSYTLTVSESGGTSSLSQRPIFEHEKSVAQLTVHCNPLSYRLRLASISSL